MNRLQLRNSLLLLLTAVVWGATFVAQSVGMDYIGPLTFLCARSFIGGLVLFPCIFLLNRKRTRAKRETAEGKKELGKIEKIPKGGAFKGIFKDRRLWLGGVCCGLALFFASWLQQAGIMYTTVGKAGFITAFYIIIVPVLGLFFKRRCSPFVWMGVVLALFGLYFLCISESLSIGKGDFLVLLCALMFSVHILIIDHFTQFVDGVQMACIQFFVCGLVAGAATLLFEEPSLAQLLNAWQPVLYAGVLASGVGYTLQIVGQKGMNPAVASLILSLESVISVLAGMLFLGQHLSGREILGCVLMSAAIVLAQLPGRRKGPVKAV